MKKYLLLLFISFSLFGQKANEKFHRAKIVFNSIENYNKLIQLGLALDHGIHKKGTFIISDFSDSELSKARNLGCDVVIEINDVQNYYINQNLNKEAKASLQNISCNNNLIEYTTPFNFNLGSMGGYFTYQEAMQELDDMYSLYPSLISQRQNISTFLTDEGRALQWTKISNNPTQNSNKPQVLYTAIHHAREPISLSETIFYMWYLLENYQTNEEVKYIVDNTELFFIPVINPDGYIYNQTTNPNGGGMWRKNRHDNGDGTFGVDPNRNYEYWINGDSSQNTWNTLGVSATTDGQTYPGLSPFSEAETQAVKYFVENHNFVYAINAHTFSNLLLFPFGYDLNVPTPDNIFFETVSEHLVQQNNFTNQIASQLYAASGGSDDFMYGQTQNHNKIFSFTPEIGSSFWPASNEIISLCNQMMFSNLNTAKLCLNYAKLDSNDDQYTGNTTSFNANFKLQKLSNFGSGNFAVSIHPISTNIESVGNSVTVSNLQLLENFNNSIQINLINTVNIGDAIDYEIWWDNGQFIEKKLINRKFGQLTQLFYDSCSSILPNFTTSVANGWNITTESFVSPSTSITDSPNGFYSSSQTKNITSTNPIVIPDLPCYLTFQTKYDLEKSYDYVEFQIANNSNFTNWTTQCGKFTLFNQPTFVANGFQAYTGLRANWVKEQIDLTDYQGQTIKYRFRFSSDNGLNKDGFYFDDITISVLENPNLSLQNQEVNSFSISPNPASSVVNIDSNFTNYSLKIFSLTGQLILNQDINERNTKVDVSFLSNGAYILEFKNDTFSEIKKLIKN